MVATSDVVVVGGGVVGAACARELSASGLRVTVLDPEGDRGQAWRAAAGMLAPQIEARQGDGVLELGLAGRELYAELAEPLREATGTDIGFWREGILHLALTDGEAVALRAKVAWQRQQGLLCDWLDAGEVRERWPWIVPSKGGMWAPNEGALAPERLVRALRMDAERRGARLLVDEAVAVESRNGRVSAVAGRRERYAAEHVVLAAGAWSGRIAGLPRPLSVEPVRGQMVALPWPEAIGRAIVYHRDGYIVARGQEAIAGSTMEYVGFDASVTPAGRDRIRAAIATLCPPLGMVEIKRCWAGLRPMTPDGLPILGAEPCLPGLWYATGHGRNGVLLAGISAVLLRVMIHGQTPTEDLSAVRPERFWSW